MSIVKKQNISTCKKGFTLIEVLVSMGVFTIIMTMVAGTISSMMVARVSARNTRAALDNVSSAIEYMIREVRSGSTYHCDVSVGNVDLPRDCAGGSNSFSFYDSHPVRRSYTFDSANGVILTAIGSNPPMKLNEPAEFWVDSFIVSVEGAEDITDTVPPFVTFKIAGHARNLKVPLTMVFQTSVSQRAR